MLLTVLIFLRIDRSTFITFGSPQQCGGTVLLCSGCLLTVLWGPMVAVWPSLLQFAFPQWWVLLSVISRVYQPSVLLTRLFNTCTLCSLIIFLIMWEHFVESASESFAAVFSEPEQLYTGAGSHQKFICFASFPLKLTCSPARSHCVCSSFDLWFVLKCFYLSQKNFICILLNCGLGTMSSSRSLQSPPFPLIVPEGQGALKF